MSKTWSYTLSWCLLIHLYWGWLFKEYAPQWGVFFFFWELRGRKSQLFLVLVRESSQATDLCRGTLQLSQAHASPFLLTAHSVSHPDSFLIKSTKVSPLTTPLVVWAMWPRCFPQTITRLLFKWLHSADVPILTPPHLPSPQLLELCSTPESTVCCCRVSDQKYMSRNERIPNWGLLGSRASGCVFRLPLFPLQWWADVLNWPTGCSLAPYTNASSCFPASC